jgi:hypothetical protein
VEKPVNDLYQTLQKLLGLHRQLLETVRMERDALVNADLNGIQEATHAKQALIEGIRAAEVERLKHVGTLALAWKKPLSELTVLNVAIQVQAKDLKAADQFRSVYNALQLLIKRITEQNQENKGTIERSLSHLVEMKRNVLGEAAPATDTYTARGQKTAGSAGSRLISKEA